MLAIEGVDVFYGNAQALWDVSSSVDKGEIVTIIGANGAGKTTTLRMVAGLLRPAKGRVTFEGQDVTALPPNQMVARGVVLVPEARQLWPAMTVLENLELGAYLRPARRRRAETLERVFAMFPVLEKRIRQKAGTLSGGEQQMLAIARGLLARPRLLLLDEPSLGLAPQMVDEVFRAIEEIHKEGTTILLVEQNALRALAIADRAYVIETGRILLSGSGDELLHNPAVRRAYLGG